MDTEIIIAIISALAALLVAVISALVSGFFAWRSQRLERELERSKAAWQGEVQKEVESYLGQQAAQREYELEAKKRLYLAIGPLKFQLLTACRDLARRVERLGEKKFAVDMDGYYGQTTLFRLLRVVALADLIERQMSFADFAVDPMAVTLLRLKQAVYRSLTDGKPVLEHPALNWRSQQEHLFSYTLSKASNMLIVHEESGSERCMHYDEFELFLEADRENKLDVPIRLLRDFTPNSKPVLWSRLVCLAYVSVDFVNRNGPSVGFNELRDNEAYWAEMLAKSADKYIRDHVPAYLEAYAAIAADGL